MLVNRYVQSISLGSRFHFEKPIVLHLVKKFSAFMEFSLKHSQHPTTCPSLESEQSSRRLFNKFLKSVLILSSRLRMGLPSKTFPSDLPTKTRYARLLSVTSVTYFVHIHQCMFRYIIIFMRLARLCLNLGEVLKLIFLQLKKHSDKFKVCVLNSTLINMPMGYCLVCWKFSVRQNGCSKKGEVHIVCHSV